VPRARELVLDGYDGVHVAERLTVDIWLGVPFEVAPAFVVNG
jgi:hypothetical protein